MNSRFWGVLAVVVLLFLVSTAGAFALAPAAPDDILIYTDLASFEAATGELTHINFENLPADGSYLPNPLALEGLIFTDPFGLQGGFCADNTCEPDPANGDGGNIVLFLNQEATIDLPLGTGGIMLAVDGMDDYAYTVQVTDFAGNVITATSQPPAGAVDYLGFTSAEGLQQVAVAAVGPGPGCSTPPCGPLVLPKIIVELDNPNLQQGVWSDPAADVSLSNADILSGLAVVSGNEVDLRVRFLDTPFINSSAHTLTWCLDTDLDATTGNACGYPGADTEFTLNGNLAALFGGEFTFEGALADVDPCDVGYYNWDSHTLMLRFPLSLLSAAGSFHYVVDSTAVVEGSDPQDLAPGVVNFNTSGGYLAPVTGVSPAFNGTPLCSTNGMATLAVVADETGTVRYLPELGILEVAPIGSLTVSDYWRTGEMDRQFRRALIEMTLPAELPGQLAHASLVLTEERGQVSSAPPVTHELSFYQPADLAITVEDFTRPTTMITTLVTEADIPTQVFTLDVTDVISNSTTATIGWRVKLEADPSHTAYDNFGSGFGATNTQVPRLLLQLVDAQQRLTPTEPATLAYTDSDGRSLHVFAATATVTETSNLIYQENAPPAHQWRDPLPNDLVLIHDSFQLNLYQGAERQPDSALQQPLTMTLTYLDNDLLGLNEETLTLYYWNGSQWEYGPCGPAQRNPAANQLIAPICRLGDYALFASNEFAVATHVVGEGAVTVEPEQTWHSYGEVITLTAVPAPGWQFTGWSGDLSGSQNPQSLQVTQTLSITATFTPLMYAINTAVIGNGTLLVEPDQPLYAYGETITITAEAASGWQFAGWSGDLTGNQNPYFLQVTQPLSITATFTPLPPTANYPVYLPVVIRP